VNEPLPTRSGMGQLITEKIYWLKNNDFNFDIVNFPHLDSHIPAIPAYAIYSTTLMLRLS
jgi:hypothetical protein